MVICWWCAGVVLVALWWYSDSNLAEFLCYHGSILVIFLECFVEINGVRGSWLFFVVFNDVNDSLWVEKCLKEKLKTCEKDNHFTVEQLTLRAATSHTPADCVVGILSDGRSPSKKNERTIK